MDSERRGEEVCFFSEDASFSVIAEENAGLP